MDEFYTSNPGKAQAFKFGDYDESKIKHDRSKNSFAGQCNQCSYELLCLYWRVNAYPAVARNHTLFESPPDTWHDPNARVDLNPPKEGSLSHSEFTISGSTSTHIGYWLEDKLRMSNVPDIICSED